MTGVFCMWLSRSSRWKCETLILRNSIVFVICWVESFWLESLLLFDMSFRVLKQSCSTLCCSSKYVINLITTRFDEEMIHLVSDVKSFSLVRLHLKQRLRMRWTWPWLQLMTYQLQRLFERNVIWNVDCKWVVVESYSLVTFKQLNNQAMISELSQWDKRATRTLYQSKNIREKDLLFLNQAEYVNRRRRLKYFKMSAI